MLSPGVSILAGLAGVVLMFYGSGAWWWTVGISAAIAAIVTYEIRSCRLFRGPNWPFAGIFMLLTAAMQPGLTGMVLGLVAAFCVSILLRCFNNPDSQRTFFTLNLICGLGALGSRSFALLALVMQLCIILLRAFSLRGFVASLLGFVTPAVLILPFRQWLWEELQRIYVFEPFVIAVSPKVLALGGLTLLAGLLTFIPSYGYPAQARARNMALLGLSAGVIAMTALDSVNADDCFTLLSVCCAYNVTHLASLRRAGWIFVVISWIVASVICRLP